MSLVSTKTIVALSVGGAGIASLEYVPAQYKRTVLIGSIVALGTGLFFLANDAQENVDAFVAEGGVLGWIGNLFSGKTPPPVASDTSETPIGTDYEDYTISAAFQNAGTLDIDANDDTYPANVRVKYSGPEASIRFHVNIQEQGAWYGVDNGGFDSPPIDFPAGKSIRDLIFSIPILGSHPGNFSSSLTLTGGPDNKLLDAGAYKLT